MHSSAFSLLSIKTIAKKTTCGVFSKSTFEHGGNFLLIFSYSAGFLSNSGTFIIDVAVFSYQVLNF
jgi:hypothetical protein